jgi:transcription elongation factor S-II
LLDTTQKLRESVCADTIAVDKLVEMTSAELASDDIIKERIALSQNLTKARRTDIYQLAAQEAQQTHGIDDGKGEFKCRKCKGTKTTHYAMQTRSSDEPMTVFVCCLGCGNRWRE